MPCYRRLTISAVLLAALLCLSSANLAGAASPRARADASTTTLIYGATSEPDTLNPLITQSPNTGVISAVFDSLLQVDPQGRLQPDLATSVGHSPDGRTWTFHLRHGVRWADGAPFTSADVAYNYQALFTKRNNIGGAVGWDQIDHLSTPDPYTVVCHLKRVYAPFLLAVGWTQLLAKHLYDRPGVDFNTTTYNRLAIGTGPYRVAEWQANDHVTLVANPYSWRGRPYFQKIVYKIVPDPNTMLIQLRTGALDVGSILESQIGQARGIAGARLVSWLDNSYERIDLKQWGFLREQAVRQALDYATPKEAILRGILHGLGRVANGDVSPLLADYYNPQVPRRPFSLAKAAALLAADRFTRGSDGILQKGGQPLSIELWAATGDADAQRINEVLQQEWSSLGIRATIHVAGDDVFYGAGGPQFSKTMTAMTNGVGNGPDPDDSCQWNSRWDATSMSGPGCNWPAYFHPYAFQKQIDALTNAGVATVDPTRRRALYFREQALLADELPVLFLYWRSVQLLVPADLHGFAANPFASPLWNVGTWRRS